MKLKHLALLVLAVLLAGCGGTTETAIVDVPTVAVLPTITPSPVPTETPVPTATATELPTETTVPSATPTNTATTVPSPTTDAEATVYIATQNALATVNAANAATFEALNASGLIPTATATPIPIQDIEPAQYFTQDGGVRVRRCQYIRPDCDDIIPELAVAIPVTVTGTTVGDSFRGSDQWFRVDINGTAGFIHSTLLGLEPPPPTPLPADLTLTALAPTPAEELNAIQLTPADATQTP